jgi:hypothetical protein
MNFFRKAIDGIKSIHSREQPSVTVSSEQDLDIYSNMIELLILEMLLKTS